MTRGRPVANTYTFKGDFAERHGPTIAVALGAVYVLAWAVLFAIE